MTGQLNLDAALVYSRRHQHQALVVQRGGESLLAAYDEAFDADEPHALYSGTKSFWGPAAMYAQRDGLLDLDEPVGATFAAWATGERAFVTLRMLLQLIAGVPFGGLGSAVPNYVKALATPLKNAPGTTFTYGGIPLQIFGAVFAEKLRARGLTPHDYLRERVLEPAGVRVARWRTLKDGTHPLPTGAFVSAPMWAAYGAFVQRERDDLADVFTPSPVNPRYGLGWWLHDGVRYASGSGGQALYLLPDGETVVVRFAAGGSYKHEAFLSRLLR